MASRPNAQVKYFSPAANSECLCGSGEKFKHCCSGNLPGFDIRKKTRAAADVGDYITALAEARRDVTQYTIWHKTNTAPVLRACRNALPAPIAQLLTVDVNALGSYVEMLGGYYCHLDRANEFSVVLERLRSNINDTKWHRKISYLHTIQALGKNWNREAGRVEFKKLGSMDDETDIQLLQLYIDLFGEELGFSARKKFADRIARLTKNIEEKLHYRCVSAISLWMVGDQAGADLDLQSAIHDYAMARDEDGESAYGLSHYALAFEALGQLRQDKLMLEQAADLCRQFIARDDLSAKGLAEGYRQLGDTLRYQAKWQEAKDAYSTALQHEHQGIFNVFISQCLLYLAGSDAAQQSLTTATPSNLSAAEFTDYAFILAQVAIESGAKSLLVNAEQTLRALSLNEPHFQEQRNTLLLTVIDTLHAGPSAERTEKTRNIISKGVSAFLRYIKLEPNVMGIGINVGKIIDDYRESRNT